MESEPRDDDPTFDQLTHVCSFVTQRTATLGSTDFNVLQSVISDRSVSLVEGYHKIASMQELKRPFGLFYVIKSDLCGGSKMSKGKQTRQRIVVEAANLFNRRGYKGSSLKDVMEATGLEKGGIYRHFSSKEELAAAAFDHAWGEAFEVRQYGLDSINNNVDKLKQLISNCVERRPSIPG